MEVLRATAMGLCFGVREALAEVARAARPAETAIVGQLVHNERVLAELAERGFTSTTESDRQIPIAPIVMITAHGISDRQRERLQAAGKELIDTTCPLVQRVHAAARSLERDGFHILVVGRPKHVEVLGITGDLKSFEVIDAIEQVRCYGRSRLGIVCQSTTSPELAEQIHAEVQRLNPLASIRFVNTICHPTLERRQAVLQLLPLVDAIVVVGGAHSNNTQQLAELCERHGVATYHVQSAADLRSEWFRQCHAVGLTAGTSTLDACIDEVETHLRAIAPGKQQSRLRSSASWVRYFRRNAAAARDIDWHNFAPLEDGEAKALGHSIAIFQRGEDGTGKRFLRRASLHARATGDPQYLEAVRLFVAEEQRHAAELGRFLDLAGLPRASFVGTDRLFRTLRGMARLELTVRVLLTAETLAKVYYSALRAGTSHWVLRQLCTCILRDEVAHVQFQAQRVAMLNRHQRLLRPLKRLLHRMFYYAVSEWIWWTHRSVFRAAQWRRRDYRRKVKRAWRVTERLMGQKINERGPRKRERARGLRRIRRSATEKRRWIKRW